MLRHISKGAWTFSDQDHGWQVSDCTAEGLKVTECVQSLQLINLRAEHHRILEHYSLNSLLFQCCLLLSMLPSEIVGKKMEPERLYDSVNVILSLQVRIKMHLPICIYYLSVLKLAISGHK